jgi:hypothetical protein
MAERMNVIAAQKGKNDKTYWNRVGSAWPRDDGSLSVSLHSMPAPSDGEFRFMIVHDDGGNKGQSKPAPKDRSNDFDDDMPPFA